MATTLVLEDARSRIEIVPELGGGIAAMDALLAGASTPVLRRWTGRFEDGPFALAMNVLAPFSNRIAAGGFACEGRFHPIEPNLQGEPRPIHGDALMRPWRVRERSTNQLSLELRDGCIGPFRYEAELRYALSDGTLAVELEVINRSGCRLPFGGGFHPWFPRSDVTLLQFAADGFWHEDERYLPTHHVQIASVPDLDFSTARALPAHWINNAYTGWSGRALITQPDRGIDVAVSASHNLDTALVYSPGAEAGFFCFEPVSHAVDAHNRDGFPGLALLEDGERFEARARLEWTQALTRRLP